MKKKAFTLIELIAVLVILAILALIVTPLVMNIIKKSKDNANRRSVDNYYHAIELAASEYQLDTSSKANSFDVLNVKYSGNTVECDTKVVYQNNIFISKCKVGNTYVMDSKSTDGYYQVGDIDKFGDIYIDAINNAIVRYQKQNNTLPLSISDLELNLDGLDFNCNESKINGDKTLYLANCSIAGMSLENKTWGEAKYLIGDLVKYNSVKYYIIDNLSKDNTIHLMKAEPIKVSEIKEYLSSTELESKIQISSDKYLKMQYLYHDMCVSMGEKSGCSTDYDTSSIKQIVDVWMNNYTNYNDLVTDSTGYKARLITYDDLTDNLGYAKSTGDTVSKSTNGETPEFVYNIGSYWTMSTYEDSETKVWVIDNSNMNYRDVPGTYFVRPVINIKVSAIK